MIDGQFFTDTEAEQAIREACSKGSVAAPQPAGAALEALGVRPQGASDKRAKHDSAKADTNHPTVSVSRAGLGLSGFGRVFGLVGVLQGGPPVWSPEACSFRSYTSACARVSDRCSEAQQVRSASKVLGKPEPASEAPLALNRSTGTHWLKSRAACRFPPDPCPSVLCVLLRRNKDRLSKLGTRGGPSFPGRPGQEHFKLGTRGAPGFPGRPGQEHLLLGTRGGPSFSGRPGQRHLLLGTRGGPSLSGRPGQAETLFLARGWWPR